MFDSAALANVHRRAGSSATEAANLTASDEDAVSVPMRYSLRCGCRGRMAGCLAQCDWFSSRGEWGGCRAGSWAVTQWSVDREVHCQWSSL